jgi:hypothetical protein
MGEEQVLRNNKYRMRRGGYDWNMTLQGIFEMLGEEAKRVNEGIERFNKGELREFDNAVYPFRRKHPVLDEIIEDARARVFNPTMGMLAFETLVIPIAKEDFEITQESALLIKSRLDELVPVLEDGELKDSFIRCYDDMVVGLYGEIERLVEEGVLALPKMKSFFPRIGTKIQEYLRKNKKMTIERLGNSEELRNEFYRSSFTDEQIQLLGWDINWIIRDEQLWMKYLEKSQYWNNYGAQTFPDHDPVKKLSERSEETAKRSMYAGVSLDELSQLEQAVAGHFKKRVERILT